MEHSRDTLQQLAVTSEWFHPYLVFEKNESGSHPIISSLADYRWDTKANISDIYKALQSQYPKAGPQYWSARCWTLIYWQLVYINLACVHRLNFSLPTSSIIQHTKSGSVYGYHIDSQTRLDMQERPTLEQLICHSSADLKNNLEHLFEHCSKLFKFSHKKAFRLVAASITSAITLLFSKLNLDDLTPMKDVANEWLKGMDLEGEASLITSGTNAATIRRACCMHYLIEPNNCCADCPRTRPKS